MNTLFTERLVLRPFREDDAEAVFRNWAYDERVAKYCRWSPHQSIENTKEFLKMCVGAEYSWAITLKGNDEPIGSVDVVGKNSSGVYEIGYVLMYDHWGEGIMTETVSAVIEELFRCGFDRIGACHMIDNPASGRVMEKCGMTYIRNDMSIRKFGSDEKCEVRYYEISRKP